MLPTLFISFLFEFNFMIKNIYNKDIEQEEPVTFKE